MLPLISLRTSLVAQRIRVASKASSLVKMNRVQALTAHLQLSNASVRHLSSHANAATLVPKGGVAGQQRREADTMGDMHVPADRFWSVKH